MKTNTELTGSHLRTYNTIFQHPVSHNLGWYDVHSLFRHLGTVDVETNGNLKVTVNGHTLVLHAPRTKDVSGTEEVMSLRHFIQRSEATATESSAKESHWLLVIDHHEARIFRSELHGAVPERIMPHEPAEHFRHAYGSKDFNKGKDRPNPESFFEPVAKALQGAGQILILGTGTGMSSEMDQFVDWTKKHHPDLAKRILGTVAVDEHHLTESQLLAKAREFYANAATAKA